MSNKTQLRLASITGSFGANEGQISDSLSSDRLSNLNIEDLSGVFSHIASSIKRIHGGEDFTAMDQGQFSTNLLPSVDGGYSLGNDTNSWKDLIMMSGSLKSVDSGFMMEPVSGEQLIFSASLGSVNITHKFMGAGIELDSLYATQSEYAAVGKTENVLYNIDGALYFGTTLLNAPYSVIKESVKISSVISSNSSLKSNSSFNGVDLTLLPTSNRADLVNIYFNGQLLIGGTSSDILIDNADYYMDTSSLSSVDFKFSFDLNPDDIITISSQYVSNSAASADFNGAVSQNHRSELLAVGEASGEIVTFGTGTLVAGKIYYLSGSSWSAADAATIASAEGMIGMAIGTSPADGILVRGYYHPSTSILTNFSGGKPVYVSTTGAYSTVAPTGSGNYTRIIGYCTATSNIISFNPESTWIELN